LDRRDTSGYSAEVEVVSDIRTFRKFRKPLGRLALVPTMGALHAGHISLVEVARRHADHVVVSIFVNPTQFGPHEDFSKYPRTLEADLKMCQQAKVDVVFTPGVHQMYPPHSPDLHIEPTAVASPLEGVHRPGHFAGVCQVVAKLFNITLPDVACFGEKDFQQLAVLRAMTLALCFPIDIVGCHTLRESSGLAMSSRNRYLSDSQHARATSISRSLRHAQQLAVSGVTDVAKILDQMKQILLHPGEQQAVPVELQYASIVNEDTMQVADVVNEKSRALVAMKVGETRLIDNMLLIDPQPQPNATEML